MAGNKRHRGFSAGTVLMLLVTLAVLGGFALVLPKLQGDTVVQVDGSRVLEALQWSDGAPALTLEEIPIIVETQPQQTLAAVQPQVTEAPTQPPQVQHVRLTWGGSVFLEKAVRQSGFYQSAKAYDYREVLAALRDKVSSEAAVVSLHQLVMPEAKVSDLNAPPPVLDMQRDGGFKQVSLAFGQCYDQGRSGALATIGAVQEAGLGHLGVYQDANDAGGRILTVSGASVALLQYTASLSSRSTKLLKNEDAADEVPLAEIERIREDIDRALRNGAEAVLVGIDWGTGAKTTPTKSQLALCQEIAEAGADVIVGTGSQVVQAVTWLEGKSGKQVLCAYNLGALLCASRKNANVAGMLLQLDFVREDSGLRLNRAGYTPTYIWRYKLDGQYSYRVVPADGEIPDGMGDQEASLLRAAETVRKAVGEAIPLWTEE